MHIQIFNRTLHGWQSWSNHMNGLTDQALILASQRLPTTCGAFVIRHRTECKVIGLSLTLFALVGATFAIVTLPTPLKCILGAVFVIIILPPLTTNLSRCMQQCCTNDDGDINQESKDRTMDSTSRTPSTYSEESAEYPLPSSITSESANASGHYLSNITAISSSITNTFWNIFSEVKEILKDDNTAEIAKIEREAEEECVRLEQKITYFENMIDTFDKFVAARPDLVTLSQKYFEKDKHIYAIQPIHYSHFASINGKPLDLSKPLHRSLQLALQCNHLKFSWEERINFADRHPDLKNLIIHHAKEHTEFQALAMLCHGSDNLKQVIDIEELPEGANDYR